MLRGMSLLGRRAVESTIRSDSSYTVSIRTLVSSAVSRQVVESEHSGMIGSRCATRASRRHHPTRRVIATARCILWMLKGSKARKIVSGEAAGWYHGTLCGLDSVHARCSKVQKTHMLSSQAPENHGILIQDMHDDAVMASDWSKSQNVGEGQRWLI